MDMLENLLGKMSSANEDEATRPHSCGYCQRIVISEDFDEDLWSAKAGWVNLTFDCTLAVFEEAVRKGCLLCRAICNGQQLPKGLPAGVVLAACFSPHMINPGSPDQLGPFALVDMESKTLVHRFNREFKPIVRALPGE
jgi:hypothetical protein